MKPTNTNDPVRDARRSASRRRRGALRVALFLGTLAVAAVALAATARAQSGDSTLFFREDWAETPPSLPITPEHVAHPDLKLHLYGNGPACVKKSHHENPPLDPYYVWSGRCEGTWAVTLSREEALADLSGPAARVEWRSRPTGFRRIRLILKRADGSWLVSEQADALAGMWHTRAFPVQSLQWRSLDIETMTEGARVDDPDLSRVAEIGFTDLMRGGSSPASTRIDWIAVYGNDVIRDE
jgi:hypothetical protein